MLTAMPKPVLFTPKPVLFTAILSVKAAASYLGISRTQMLHLLSGRFPGPRLKHARAGRRIIIRQQWLEAWLEESARYEGNKE